MLKQVGWFLMGWAGATGFVGGLCDLWYLTPVAMLGAIVGFIVAESGEELVVARKRDMARAR